MEVSEFESEGDELSDVVCVVEGDEGAGVGPVGGVVAGDGSLLGLEAEIGHESEEGLGVFVGGLERSPLVFFSRSFGEEGLVAFGEMFGGLSGGHAGFGQAGVPLVIGEVFEDALDLSAYVVELDFEELLGGHVVSVSEVVAGLPGVAGSGLCRRGKE